MGFFCANNYDTTKARVMMRDARKKKVGSFKESSPSSFVEKSFLDEIVFFSQFLTKLFFVQLKNGVPF